MKFLSILFGLVALAVSPVGATEVTPLVGQEWLAEHAHAPDVVVVDTRSREDYGAGHIPGAVHADYGRDGWRVTNSDGTPGMFPDDADRQQRLAANIGALGIGNDTHVVLVSRGRNESDLGVATRMYWTFKVLGHDRVSILDGGMASYLAEGTRPLTREGKAPAPRHFSVSVRREMIANEAEVRQAMQRGLPLIDARPESQFSGRLKSGVAVRPGTITNALSLPAANLIRDRTGVLRESAALARLFEATGAGTHPILFCNTGHWASVNWFVASELLGMKGARLYDGSMAEWSADPNNPMTSTVE